MHVLVAVAALAAATQSPPPVLWVELEKEVGSRLSAPGSPISAVVLENYVTIPMGARILGKVAAATTTRPNTLRLEFDTLAPATPITARVVAVDNARETMLPDGTIVGLDALRKKPSRIELLLLAAAHAHPAFAIGYEAAKYTLRKVEHPEVRFTAGTRIALAVELASGHSFPEAMPEAPPPPALVGLLSGLPLRTTAKHPPQPSDWTNLVFLASRERLTAALTAAGWDTADRLSVRADVRTFLAVAEHHEYQRAPVSILLLYGRPPDLVYQRQTNTFAKRHHMRIWSTGASWHGVPLWIAAATHDIGIEFSVGAKTFTHRIDSNVDLERANVIRDLTFARQTSMVQWFPRAAVAAGSGSHNATGDSMTTDGRLAVVTLAP